MKGKKGFTYIELMIILAIAVILAAIAIPSYLKYIRKSKSSDANINLKAIGDGSTDWSRQESVPKIAENESPNSKDRFSYNLNYSAKDPKNLQFDFKINSNPENKKFNGFIFVMRPHTPPLPSVVNGPIDIDNDGNTDWNCSCEGNNHKCQGSKTLETNKDYSFNIKLSSKPQSLPQTIGGSLIDSSDQSLVAVEGGEKN